MFKLAISHATLIEFSFVFWGLGDTSAFGDSLANGFSVRGVTGGDGEGEFAGAGCCDCEIRVKSDRIEDMSDFDTSSLANIEVG
jgi:hypothetical protein